MYTFKLCDLQTMHLFFSLSKINGVHAHGKRELNIGTPHCFVDDVYAYMYSVYSEYNTHTFHPFIHSHIHGDLSAHPPTSPIASIVFVTASVICLACTANACIVLHPVAFAMQRAHWVWLFYARANVNARLDNCLKVYNASSSSSSGSNNTMNA